MKLKNQKLSKIKKWIRSHKKITVLLSIFILALIFLAVWLLILNKQPEEITTIEEPKIEKPKVVKKHYSTLSGVQVENESDQNKPILGVMIENSPNARPQSGLKNAEIVFEAVAEAGITRFLAIYQLSQPELIGPVRSVREYYIDWAGSFDSSIAHVGGSSAALARMRDGSHKDMDQFFNTATFWRSTDRYAPHNVYTNYQNLLSLNTTNGWNSPSFTPLKRKDGVADDVSSYQTAQNISMNFSSQTYNTSYSYNSECNCYIRSQAGSIHEDREAGQITPKVVIAMKVNMWLDSDNYHNQIETVGSGEAIIFQDGKAIAGSWQKDSEKTALIFKDTSGNNIELNRGQTWIGAIPNSSGSVSWE